MPQTELVQTLLAGEKATLTGPGLLEFKTVNMVPHVAAVTTTKTAGGGMAVLTKGGVAAAQGGSVVTGTATSAQSVSASLLKGKLLGFSLGSVNPWLLIAGGALITYLYTKKKWPRLVW